MQTVAICGQRGKPRGLRLSLREQFAVHGILTAGVVGLLLYPISLIFIASTTIAAVHGSWPTDPWSQTLLALNFGNLAAILTASAVSSLRGLHAAGALRLAGHILLLPIYWALMSFAAWQASYQYFRSPSMWEKTQHGVARKRRAPHRRLFV